MPVCFFLQGLLAFRHSRVFSCSFRVREMSSAVPLGFCKSCYTALPSQVSVTKTLSVTYSGQPKCFSLVLLTYCPFPSADSLAVHCC